MISCNPGIHEQPTTVHGICYLHGLLLRKLTLCSVRPLRLLLTKHDVNIAQEENQTTKGKEEV
jgi:hypothetical protein